MSLDVSNAIENKQDALKFLVEESLSFFRRFQPRDTSLSIVELDGLNDIRAKLNGGITLAEQLLISATINGLGQSSKQAVNPRIYSQVRKNLVEIHALVKGLMTDLYPRQTVMNIRKLLVKIKYLLPREVVDYENFEKLIQKVQNRISSELYSLPEIIQTQKDFAVLAFLGNNLFSEELSGETGKDVAMAKVRGRLLPQFIEVMGLLVGHLNDLNDSLDKNIYSEKENKMISVAYEAMSASLKNIEVR